VRDGTPTTSESVEPTPEPRTWLAVAGVLVAAGLAGGLLGLIYTAATGGSGATLTPSVPVASTSQLPVAEFTPTLGSPPPSPPPTPTAYPTPSLMAASPSGGAVTEGCFFEGLGQPEVEGTEPIVAEDLAARLPLLDPVAEPGAWVGSSLTSSLGGAYVNGFEACLGADPATIRFGTTRGRNTVGIALLAAQVDGYSGRELADVMVAGAHPDADMETLRVREHAGWTYRTSDAGFAVTASEDTVYWMQQFCCVDPGPDADLPTFDEVVRDYLEAIIDEPA
jgi:hypothetical protein